MKTKLKYLLCGLLTIISLSSIANGYTFTNYQDGFREQNGSWLIYRKSSDGWFHLNCGSSGGFNYGVRDKETVGVSRDYTCPNIKFPKNYYSTPVIFKPGNVLDQILYYYWSEDRVVQDKYVVSMESFNIPKNGLLNFFWKGITKDYDSFVFNNFGYTLINTQKSGIFDFMTSAGGQKFYNMYLRIENNDLAIYDIGKGRKYVRVNPFDDWVKEMSRGGYNVPRIVQETPPSLVWEATYSKTEGENILASTTNVGGGVVNPDNLGNELFFGVSLGQLIQAPFSLNDPDGGVEINEGSPSGSESSNKEDNNQAQTNYNQCVNYWEDIKVLASYMGECRKAIGAPSAGLLPYADFERWEKLKNEDRPSFNIPLPDNFPISCRKLEKLRERLEKRYPEKYEEILDKAEDYANNPSLINVELKCGSKLVVKKQKDEEAEKYSYFASTGLTNTLKELFSIRGDEDIPACSFNGNELLLSDYTKDLELLKDHRAKCHGLKFFGVFKTEPGPDAMFYCSLYSTTKQTLLEKRKNCFREENAVRFPIEKVIETLESTGTGGALKYAKDKTLGSISDLGNEVLKLTKDPFLSGYNEQLLVKCVNTFTIESMDIFVYLLFFFIIFIFFKNF